MNCDVIQRRLLALTEPAEPTSTIQTHLAQCPACQEVQRRLLMIEKHVPLLPAPPVPAKAAFLQRIRTEATVWEKLRFRLKAMDRWQVTAASLAASLLLFALVWALAPADDHRPVVRTPLKEAPDPLLDRLVDFELKLAGTDSTADCVVTLSFLADNLRGQAQPLFVYGTSKEGKECLRDLADWYGQVVRLGVARAVDLEAPQRGPVLGPIARKLGQAADDTESLARASKVMSVDHPLHTIFLSARNGKEQLASLLRAETGALPPENKAPAAQDEVAVLGSQAALLTASLGKSLALPSPAPCWRCGLVFARTPGLIAAGSAAVRAEPAPSNIVVGAEQAARFQQNRRLIRGLVDSSLQLAGSRAQDDPLQRSEACMVAARPLADEIQLAAWNNDPGRAAELAQFFKSVLQRGVAFNLTSANVPKGSAREPVLLQITDHAAELTTKLEEGLRRIPDPEVQERLEKSIRAVADGRAAVLKALAQRPR